MAILVDCSLGRQTYTNLQKMLKQLGHNILPPWMDVRKVQTKISPEPEHLPAPHTGVHFNFLKSMQLTAGRIVEDIAVKHNPTGVVMNIKYGFDGSGNHAIYQQLNNKQKTSLCLCFAL